MTDHSAPLHVYLRQIAQGERTSLSVLASFVKDGATVLDLGTGSGALGAYLREHHGCQVDGVTINEQEAALARPHYRRVVVANLDRSDWVDAFAGEQYDFIVCADVLEHLQRPETAVRDCRGLLAPGGQLLVSIPNASYSGLIADLLEGDFAYRDEGLLDRTHLRFFTRRSFTQFMADLGWHVEAVEAITRPLNESEFRTRFDALPPAVARYLLAQPDAGTYQLIFRVRPGEGSSVLAQPLTEPAAARFSAMLYFGTGASGYSEDRKRVTAGTIGNDHQLLRFELPRDGEPVTRLRLDPADRPGFLRLYRIGLRAGDHLLWQWACEKDGLEPLRAAPHQDLLMRAPWPATTALLLMHGDDPSIELPVPAAALAACEGRAAVLEVELGWPMSGDFMALAEAIRPLEAQIEQREQQVRDVEQLRQQAIEAHHATERSLAQAQARIEKLAEQQRELEEQIHSLTERHDRTAEEKNTLARHRLALQGELAQRNQEYEALADHLRWIERSTVFRATRPLVNAKMALERLAGRRAPDRPAPAPLARPIEPTVATVDVIVPVYRGLSDTRLCIESVLASHCRTPWRLVVVNDASPEPEVTQWLREVAARDNRILLLENEQNLGFVGPANRGMSQSDAHDVLLLNSDTEVAGDWLDRIRRAAYSDERVASVTPFSNNATICSYPRFCKDNELPPGWSTAALDQVFARVNAGQVVDVPTGVGFCMYVRRDCLRDIGLFDTEQFGKGYGEENDLCRRAAEAGWRNLLALDTFVLHTGGVSFGDSKSQREIEAVEKLRKLHPSYDRVVHEHVMADPAREARLAVDLERVRMRGLPVVLAVLHDRGGGTQRHAEELAAHLHPRATFFSLTPAPGGSVVLDLLEPEAGFRLEFALPAELPELLQALRALGVAHIHYHHVLGHRPEVLRLGEQLGVHWDFTVHDYYAMCPQITLTDATDRFCGEQGNGECGRCLPAAPAPGGEDIKSWRARHGDLLVNARHVLSPSRDAARRIARMWATADVRLAPHTDMAALPSVPVPVVRPLAADAPLKVVVLGALSRIKGADLLEDVARLAAKGGASVEFHLIGYAYRELLKQPRAALTVYGPYQESDLPGLLRWLKPDLVWFPALWPETYSYTLSACLAEGLPVAAPDLGAFPERLSGRAWSWLLPWDITAARALALFNEAREKHFVTGEPPMPYLHAPAHDVDPLIGAWSYEADYLREVQARPMTVLDAAFLRSQRTGRAEGLERQRQRLKHGALNVLVRLRSAPVLRQVARAIPLRWQTRVKTWLRA
jgi:GT2 family glycosyltransferase/2-polyprenyl-3-methyl-5-hydroxy-6-metoxy-1,4-benzoquinol methylase/glycosyltransferase involved in cell wall biosynthesis